MLLLAYSFSVCCMGMSLLCLCCIKRLPGTPLAHSWMPSTATSRAGPSFPLLLPGLARVLSSHTTADIAALHRRCSLGSRLRV